MAPMADVDAYIEQQPEGIRALLQRLRELIVATAPRAEESIAYGMPAYKLDGKPLVYFAGFAKHIGFYATPTGHEAFADELAHYKQGKGSVQFPLNQDLPWDLIERIVRFRVESVQG